MKRRLIWITGALCAVLILCFVGFRLYTGNYYHATAGALDPVDGAVMTREADGTLTFAPEDGSSITAGLIFYPGGLVEYTSYAPLMNRLAQRGIFCVLLQVTDNLAILDLNAADGIIERYPQIVSWYIGGHSLGGVVASMYAANHAGAFRGLILLGAYANKDLSGTNLCAISLYGENDGVLNRAKYEAARSKLPADFTELVIHGGCHAYFGSYGEQSGDGTATITPAEQQEFTVEAIAEWIKSGNGCNN